MTNGFIQTQLVFSKENNDYLNKKKEEWKLSNKNDTINRIVEEHKNNRFEKGYHLVMEYFDSISDEEKPKVDKELKKLGL